MLQRFKIEDLVVQDASGVVFRTFDAETNQMVALRRFFPFGASGKGLDAEQQAAYGIAVERLSKVSHPALRSIVCGGCDPVDGMPFVATEWIEGTALQTLLWSRPLEELEAITVISLALEVCEVLSEVMAEEGIWIETNLHTIIIGGKETQRPVTFWISPLKWLGHEDGKHSLEPFIALTTSITGWAGKPFETLSTTGLGNWLAWLYSTAGTATLHEAREKLSKAVGVDPPLPVKRHTRQTTRPASTAPARFKQSSKAPARIMACTVLILLGASGWWMVRKNDATLVKATTSLVVKTDSTENEISPLAAAAAAPKVAPVSPEPVVAPTASVKQPVRNLQVAPPRPTNTPSKAPPTKAPPVKPPPKTAQPAKTPPVKPNKVFTPTDPVLVDQKDKVVAVEGILVDVNEYPEYPSVLWLEFSKSPSATEFMATVELGKAHKDLTAAKLQRLIGRKIQISGKVSVNPSGKSRRPSISIMDPAAIKIP